MQWNRAEANSEHMESFNPGCNKLHLWTMMRQQFTDNLVRQYFKYFGCRLTIDTKQLLILDFRKVCLVTFYIINKSNQISQLIFEHSTLLRFFLPGELTQDSDI